MAHTIKQLKWDYTPVIRSFLKGNLAKKSEDEKELYAELNSKIRLAIDDLAL